MTRNESKKLSVLLLIQIVFFSHSFLTMLPAEYVLGSTASQYNIPYLSRALSYLEFYMVRISGGGIVIDMYKIDMNVELYQYIILFGSLISLILIFISFLRIKKFKMNTLVMHLSFVFYVISSVIWFAARYLLNNHFFLEYLVFVALYSVILSIVVSSTQNVLCIFASYNMKISAKLKFLPRLLK